MIDNITDAIATLTIDPPTNSLNSSTFDSNSFTITNNSNNGQEIERVVIDISSAILKDLVFDIDGRAGDPLGKGFTVNNRGNVGQTSFNYLTPFNNGFTGLEIFFTDFQPGETIGFSIDVDPSSIQGLLFSGPGLSGKISGLELVGSTVTVDFSDDTSAVGQPYYIAGTNDASTAVIKAELPSQSDLAILDLSTETITAEANQTVRISGSSGSEVSLLITEGALFTDNGNGFDLDPFEANSAIAIQEITATIGTQGYVDIPVTLTRTDVNSGEAGLNIFTAVIKDSDGIQSLTSNLVTVEYDPQFTGDNNGGDDPESVRINAGGNAFTDTEGNIWSGDRSFENGRSYRENTDIVNTDNDSLYNTERFIPRGNSLSYEIPLENGDYEVKLKFAEIYFNESGKRIFNVAAEETTIISNLDIFELAGGRNIALDRSFTVTVDDGILDLDFISQVENAKVSAIEVLPLAGLIGGAGNDTIDGTTNFNLLDGGEGRDLLDYRNSQAGVNIDLSTNTADGGDATGDTIRNFESIFGSTKGDRLTGNAQNNILWGFTGNDTIAGGAGNDIINGGAGADLLDGGTGKDRLNYSSSANAVEINLATNTADGGDATGDTIRNFESIFGSIKGDRLTGNAQSNAIRGFDGNDTISGGANRDILDGGKGRDLLDYRNSQAGVNIDLSTNTADGGDATGDTIRNFESIFGSTKGDRLTGNAQNNILWGFTGNDTIAGGAGNDIINGGAGADLLDGGTGKDRLNYSSSANAVEINLATNTADGGDATGDTIRNFESIFGSIKGDRLTGNAQSNTLHGYRGNDILTGGAGKDRLIGGTGNDTFTLTTSNESLFDSFDLITDFNTAEDSIDAPMEINGIDNFGTVNSLNASEITITLSSLNAGNAGILELNSRTFMAINDSNPGFDVAQDIFLEITGYTGDINNLEII